LIPKAAFAKVVFTRRFRIFQWVDVKSSMINNNKIKLVINRINEKNLRMFFDNIVYVSFIDVIFVFVIRLKKQDFVWNMYKKTLINKSIHAMICDIEKKHDLFLLKYRSIEKFVNVIQSHKKILANTIF
jgi:hypothetical protein